MKPPYDGQATNLVHKQILCLWGFQEELQTYVIVSFLTASYASLAVLGIAFHSRIQCQTFRVISSFD